MKDIEIKISNQTRMVDITKSCLGNDAENLQGNLLFTFKDEFVNGIARLEVMINGEKSYLMLESVENGYRIPIKSVLTKEGHVEMQLVITESEKEEGIPVFKSNVFYLYVNRSINAAEETPEEYPLWIDIANAKIMEIDQKIAEVEGKIEGVDNLDITTKDLEEGVEVTITNKQGVSKTEIIKDGEKGEKGDTPMISFRITDNGDIYYATEDLIDGDMEVY